MENRVLQTRVRFARNISAFPFPPAMTSALSQQVLEEVFLWSKCAFKAVDYQCIRLNDLAVEERLRLFHRHLISSDFLENTLERGLILSADEELSIMVNEEDHLRIQVLKQGYDLWKAFAEALEVHRDLENQFEFAFDHRLGYLTSCTTNVGTGMRASVQLHLPGLTLSNDTERIVQSFTNLGIEFRGTYGERSEVFGDVYQVSNKRTLGVSEDQIIRELEQVITMLLKAEDLARQQYILGNLQMEDRMYRAIGLIRYAKRLGYKESFDLLSLLRLGSEMMLSDFPSLLVIDLALDAIKAQSVLLQIQSEDKLATDRASSVRAILF